MFANTGGLKFVNMSVNHVSVPVGSLEDRVPGHRFLTPVLKPTLQMDYKYTIKVQPCLRSTL